MKILLDTNIVLDVLLNRPDFVIYSSQVMSHVEQKTVDGFLCATTLTTLDYLISKSLSRPKAKESIRKLLEIFSIAEVNSTVLSLALDSNFKDFEDAVQYFSAQNNSIDAIITRNIKDYINTDIPKYTPQEFLDIL